MTKLAYVDESGGVPAVWISNVAGTDHRRLTNSTYPEESPVFSENGQRVAFVRRLTSSVDFRNRDEVFIIDADGTHERRLTNNLSMDRPLRFGESDKSLYFISTSSFSVIAKLDLTSGDVKNILTIKTAYGCSLSRDERTAVFIEPTSGFAGDIFCAAFESPKKRRLTTFNEHMTTTRFGFNDVYFTFLVDPDGSGLGDIYLYDLQRGEAQKITSSKF